MSAVITKLSDAANGVVSALNKKLGLKQRGGEMDLPMMVLVAFGLLCVTVPLELSQLSFAFVGAVAYAAIQSTKKATQSKLQKKGAMKGGKSKTWDHDGDTQVSKSVQQRVASVPRSAPKSKRDTNMSGKQEVWQPSVQPVSAPTFSVDSFEAQVQELLVQIAPSVEGDRVVQQLALAAKKLLQKLFPQAEVSGFASADIMRGSAFAVAIPEIDIVLNAPPAMLAESLQNRMARPLPHAGKLDAYKLQKSALRACTDDLVVGGGFKFRRSAFKGMEPKVTLIAPVSMGIHTAPIPISFSVNTVTPFYAAAFMTECGQMEARAKDLILLVRRWAKDRGISHAAKGHLSPYVWTLLVVYFLQVHDCGCGPLLPALSGFRLSSGLRRKQDTTSNDHAPGQAPQKSVATLFTEFAGFYLHAFNWRSEAVCVRTGRRASPGLSLPLHVAVDRSGCTVVAPCIEDPFDCKQNLSSHMTAVSIERLREEMSRAVELCSQNVSLSELLEPWTPVEPPTEQGSALAGGLDAE